MRPRFYDTYAEQKQDQRIGFIAFPIVTLAIWLTIVLLQGQINTFDTSATAAQLKQAITVLPWAVNFLVIVPLLILRWHIAIGYFVSLAGWTVLSIGLGLIGLVIFFASTPLLALTDLVGLVIFLLVLLVISVLFVWKMIGLLRNWWAV